MYQYYQFKLKLAFTLLELIITMVIIGIIVAITVPIGFRVINFVKRYNAYINVELINSTIKQYQGSFLSNYYLEPDYLIEFIESENLTLKSNLKDYYYWYNYKTSKVEYHSISTLTFENIIQDDDYLYKPLIWARRICDQPLLLIDQSDRSLSNSVNTIADLLSIAISNSTTFDPTSVNPQLIDLFDIAINNLDNQSIINHLKSFNPSICGYINDFNYYGSTNPNHLIISDDTLSLPNLDHITFDLQSPVYLPINLRMDQGYNFNTSIIITNITQETAYQFNQSVIKSYFFASEMKEITDLNFTDLEITLPSIQFGTSIEIIYYFNQSNQHICEIRFYDTHKKLFAKGVIINEKN